MFFIFFNSLILKINIKIKNIILIYFKKKTLTKSLVRERNGYRKLEYWIRSACPMTRKGTKKDTFLSLSLTFDKDDRHMAHITRFKFLWVFNLWAPQEPREKEEMQQLPFSFSVSVAAMVSTCCGDHMKGSGAPLRGWRYGVPLDANPVCVFESLVCTGEEKKSLICKDF